GSRARRRGLDQPLHRAWRPTGRQHLQGPGGERAPRHGGSVRRHRPGAQRLPARGGHPLAAPGRGRDRGVLWEGRHRRAAARGSVRGQFTAEVSRFLIDSPEEHHRVGDLLNSFAPKLKSRLQLYQGPEPIFEHTGVERELEKALRRKVWLKSGGYIVVDRTEALTVIDVNTGKYVGKTDLASTILRTNMEAVGEIVRQITLRDIGGIILVDFIDMEAE